jgi:prevent-host-death family protein
VSILECAAQKNVEVTTPTNTMTKITMTNTIAPRSRRPRRAGPGRPRLAAREVSLADAKKGFSELCNRVGYGRDTVVLTRRGKPLAAIVSVDDLERYLALEDERASRMLVRAVKTSRGIEKVRPL